MRTLFDESLAGYGHQKEKSFEAEAIRSGHPSVPQRRAANPGCRFSPRFPRPAIRRNGLPAASRRKQIPSWQSFRRNHGSFGAKSQEHEAAEKEESVGETKAQVMPVLAPLPETGASFLTSSLRVKFKPSSPRRNLQPELRDPREDPIAHPDPAQTPIKKAGFTPASLMQFLPQ